MATWKRRQSHLYTSISKYPRRLRQDALDLAKIFLRRKALKLRLSDSYLMLVWDCSKRTVTRRLQALEEKGFLRRITFPPRRKNGGGWEQLRYLYLLVKKKVRSKLDSQNVALLEQGDKHPAKNQPPGKSRRTPFSFEDYLAQRPDVPLKSFLFWMRKWGADPRSMGYLRRIWEGVSNRADLLESILWDAEAGGYQRREKVAFVVAEIKARTYA